jgi:surface protein
MKITKTLLLLIAITLFACKDDDTPSPATPATPSNAVRLIYLDTNGVTIKASASAIVGDTGTISGILYTVVNRQILEDLIDSNANVTNICISRIADMLLLFSDKVTFNQDISSWDVSNVISMSLMFDNASAFNQDISSWDVSNVISMGSMFSDASAFNQDINSWNVSNVTNMIFMFRSASAFNQNLSTWNVNNVTQCYSFRSSTPAWTMPQPNFTNCNP